MDIDLDKLWRRVAGELEVSMSGATFNSWIKPCFLRSLTPINEERVIVELATPTGFHSNTIDERYYGQIKQTIEKMLGKKCELALVVDGGKKIEKPTVQNKQEVGLFEKETKRDSTAPGLSPRYVFESYVVGSSNALAYAAGKAVVENPGARHNPLFIWGGVGVGKTHLMHAVGHGLYQKGIERITCISSEQFTNDLVNSLRSRTIDAFKKKYRGVGALLIDDVQFFAGKESSQEEFFHTFNELYQKGVQIVMTCDRKPQDIEKLEERLVSRFLGGLTVDIGQPDFEMRMAILKQKAVEMAVKVDDKIIETIATQVVTNTRELEGIFVRLATAASINNGEITPQLVEMIVGIKNEQVSKKNLRPVQVISVVAKHFDFRNKDLLGKSRKAELVVARHIAMYLLRDELGIQLEKVGELMGKRSYNSYARCRKT